MSTNDYAVGDSAIVARFGSEKKGSGKSSTQDPINPNYYIMPDGTELASVNGWLTSNAGQAVQYIVRASRIDGVTKESTVEGRIQDISKAIKFCQLEIERLDKIK